MNKTTSLALSKRMKELGAVQESETIWISEIWKGKKEYRLMSASNEEGRMNLIASGYDVTSAFDPSELGEVFKEAGAEKMIKAYGDLFGFKGTGSIGAIGMIRLLTEPDRLGEMWCYLKENKLI